MAGSARADELILATHPLITAVPFFVPTFVVAAVVGFVIWRDRRRSAGEDTANPGQEDAGN